jgi:hypothetical protein
MDPGHAILHRLALRAYLKALARHPDTSSLFPLEIPIPGRDGPLDFAALRRRVESLERLCHGGATITYELRTSRRWGRMEIPIALRFETEKALCEFVGRSEEARAFHEDRALVEARLPSLAPWCARNTLHVIAHRGAWPELAAVVEYLLAHPRPACFPRDLPVLTDTKFIERHTGILRRLLDAVLPASAIQKGENVFEKRYGFSEEPVLIRYRLLDPALCAEVGGYSELAVPALEFTLPRGATRVFIVENKRVFHSFPKVVGGVCLWGSGFAILHLEPSRLPPSIPIWYWGDLDVQGFTILARLRKHLASAGGELRSFLMDQAAFTRYRSWAVPGTPSDLPDRAHLLEEEYEVCRALASAEDAGGACLRIEQERVCIADVLAFLGHL